MRFPLLLGPINSELTFIQFSDLRSEDSSIWHVLCGNEYTDFVWSIEKTPPLKTILKPLCCS